MWEGAKLNFDFEINGIKYLTSSPANSKYNNYEDHSKQEGNKMLRLLRKLWPVSTDWAIQSYWENLESKV